MKTINTYLFSELSPEAQAKVIEARRFTWNDDSDWYQYEKEYHIEELEKLGYDGVDSSFTGLWSSGDCASFTAKNVDIQRWIKAHNKYNEWRALYLAADNIKVWVDYRHLGGDNGYSYVAYEYWGDVSDAADDLMASFEEVVKKEIREWEKKYFRALQDEDQATWSDEYGRERLENDEYTYYNEDGKELP